jgi:hypothetical protein
MHGRYHPVNGRDAPVIIHHVAEAGHRDRQADANDSHDRKQFTHRDAALFSSFNFHDSHKRINAMESAGY